ncbi:MAG: hypothetical protein QOJ27_744, partial [Sphingomonadales bacterium]|nr:hypothetical protein [Sphingomonadales bacterium]
MMPLTRIVLALALFAVSPAAAQQVSGTDETLAQMPKELGGSPALSLGDGLLMYLSMNPDRDPTVGVMVAEINDSAPAADMRSVVHGSLEKSGIRKILREGTFTTSKWPGAATFFGEYVTPDAFNQSWMVTTAREHIMVTTTYLN